VVQNKAPEAIQAEDSSNKDAQIEQDKSEAANGGPVNNHIVHIVTEGQHGSG
jgi:hypothetical protein